MEWHLNDLSLDGQYEDPIDFIDELMKLLHLRQREPKFRQKLYCTRSLCTSRKVTRTANLQQVCFLLKDRDKKQILLNWVTRSGPFIDDDRFFNEDDLFWYHTQEVTEQGLGEAARRTIGGIVAYSFSLLGGGFDFEKPELQVVHGFTEEPIQTVRIINHWDVAQIREALRDAKEYHNWTDVYEECTHRYDGLIFSKDAADPMKSEPFNQHVAESIFERLRILNELVENTDDSGGFTEAGVELYNNHFVGGKAWFTDESDQNKRRFKKEMTFADPTAPSHMIFCPWHGKVKTPQLRIHFQWPPETGQREIKVVYIGPKITKK